MSNLSADERRRIERRKFWFQTGILVDRRARPERRLSGERRHISRREVAGQVGRERRFIAERRHRFDDRRIRLERRARDDRRLTA